MNTTDHPLVTAYLDAVARETAQLPAERRAELLADLREHVEVSGAVSEQELRTVLADLGEPRTVAASALAEEPLAGRAPAATAPDRPARTRLTVTLLGCAGLVFLFSAVAGSVALVAGLVLLWGSPHWKTREKVIGTATSAAVPVLLLGGALLLAAPRIGPMELLLLGLFSLVVPVLGAVALLRALRR
ncbi:HAAS signaling domain-containing protein [Streptomyces roseoviridis]|uniref:HAAS signaling domain-containing protein n=1 Tax=Streptomyces roseoviridis TaxID=67361 RepID=UPI0031E638F3